MDANLKKVNGFKASNIIASSPRQSHDFKKYYDNLEGIGNGAFTIVYKGREIKTKELRAIKVIQLDKLKENILLYEGEDEDLEKKLKKCIEGYKNECKNLKLCSCTNSVKFYEYFYDGNNFVIIMELCDSNLSKLLLEKKNKNTKGFSNEEIYEIMTQLNNAFLIMKNNKIIHRDLKLDNILIKYEKNNKYIVKLADYGSSKRLDSLSKNFCNTNIGTLIYMPLEILKEEKYNYKCDLWSIGVIIYILKFGKSPFNGQTENALIKNINNFNNNKIRETGNEDLDDLLKKLLEKDYEKRLNWDEYFNHPFFRPVLNKNNEYSDSEEESLIRYSGIYGGITKDSKFWDDFEEIGEEKKLLNSKIIKIKIYTGKFKGKDAIFGVSFTYRNLINGKELIIEHKGSDNFLHVEELEIKEGEYLTDFHIRFAYEAEYISQLGYSTNKKNSILVGTEEGGEDYIIGSIRGKNIKNIVVGSFGCINKMLDATGVLFISKKEFLKIKFFGLFALRYLMKKDKQFKEEWDRRVRKFDFPFEYQCIWDAVQLANDLLLKIIKYLFL